jgi:hypothetical protein
MLLSGIPFWFLPRSLPKQGEENKLPPSPPTQDGTENNDATSHQAMALAEIAKGGQSFIEPSHSGQVNKKKACPYLCTGNRILCLSFMMDIYIPIQEPDIIYRAL